MPTLTKKPGDILRASGTVTNTGNIAINDCKVAIFIRLQGTNYSWVQNPRYDYGYFPPGASFSFTKEQANMFILSDIKPGTYDALLSVVDTDPSTWEYKYDTGYDVEVQPMSFSVISFGAGLYLGVDTFYNGIQTGSTQPTYSPGASGGCAVKFKYVAPNSTKLRFKVHLYDWWNAKWIDCKDVTIDVPSAWESVVRGQKIYSPNVNFGYFSDSTYPLSLLDVGYILDNFVLPQKDDYRVWRIAQSGSEVIYRSEYAINYSTLGMVHGYNCLFTLPGVQPNWRSGDSFDILLSIYYPVWAGDWSWQLLADLVVGNLRV